jgi:hypothetical protein
MPGGAKNYVFTVNNYDSLIYPDEWPLMTYCIYQEEIGESGTPHLQGYVSFSEKRTLVTVSQLPGLERARLATAKGSAAQNKTYCTKADALGGPYEYGTPPAGQGQRKDLDVIADKLKQGVSLKRIAIDHPSDFIRYSTGLHKLQSYVAPRRSDNDETICFVFFGAGGTGKSSFARKLARRLSSEDGASGDVFSLSPSKGSGQYWDGYNQHDVVIIDEFKGNRMQPTDFNQLIDAGEFCVPVHHGQVQFNSKVVIITTNVHPSQWWPNVQFKHSLRRRLIMWPLFRRLDFKPKSRPSVIFDPTLGQFIHPN